MEEGSPESVRKIEDDSVNIENYHYDILPAGSKDASQKKSMEMKIIHSDNHLLFTMNTVSKKETEEIKVEMNPDGYFISGTRDVVDSSGKSKFQASMWREQKTVYVKRLSGGSWKTKKYRLPKDKPLAVDGSLLYLIRSFPFDQNQEWSLFMIDFSQRSVSISVRQAGLQNIRVKAGDFECYRIEVTVHVFIFRPKIIYWISKEKPHFLVKHYGKIGPLSRTYETSLVSMQHE